VPPGSLCSWPSGVIVGHEQREPGGTVLLVSPLASVVVPVCASQTSKQLSSPAVPFVFARKAMNLPSGVIVTDALSGVLTEAFV
jgi:hypothetical protein